jgi:hypothetical protein
MNRRRWRKTQPFWITQGEQARRTHWHIWKLSNIWSARCKRTFGEVMLYAVGPEQPEIDHAQAGVIVL